MRAPRYTERPAALVGFEIDERFWFVASVLNGHDRHALSGPPLPPRREAGGRMMRSRGQHQHARRKAHAEKKKTGIGWETSTCLRVPRQVTCAQLPATRPSNKERLEIRLTPSMTRSRSNAMRVPHPKSSNREHLIECYEVGLNYSQRTERSGGTGALTWRTNQCSPQSPRGGARSRRRRGQAH